MRRSVGPLVAAAIVALLVTPLTASAPLRTTLPANPWTGNWRTDAGHIWTLVQSGSSLRGTSYRACDRNPEGIINEGRITSVDGRTAEFTYTGKPNCPGEGGKYTAVMSADARTIHWKGVTQYGTPFAGAATYVGGGTEPRSTTPTLERVRLSFAAEAYSSKPGSKLTGIDIDGNADFLVDSRFLNRSRAAGEDVSGSMVITARARGGESSRITLRLVRTSYLVTRIRSGWARTVSLTARVIRSSSPCMPRGRVVALRVTNDPERQTQPFTFNFCGVTHAYVDRRSVTVTISGPTPRG